MILGRPPEELVDLPADSRPDSPKLNLNKGLTRFICGPGFDKIIQAIQIIYEISENDEGILVFDIPSLALRMGHNLKKCGHIKRG
jgi:hypothetical protein